MLHLTENSARDRGSFFTSTMRNVSSFSTAFQFRITNPGGGNDSTGSAGADGLVFVIQRAGATSLGANGEGLGYLNITNSLGVEFDTWLNSNRGDLTSNHVGIDTGGSVNSVAQQSVATNFDNGALWSVWIDYNGSTLEVRANTTGIRPASSLLSYPLTLSTLNTTLGGTTAYVGFTASTGSAFEDIDLVKWTYSDSYISGGVNPGQAIPEPSTWTVLAGVTALALAGLRRRFFPRS